MSPHIASDRRELCKSLPNCKNFGELHYFFGQQIQDAFVQKPSYDVLRNLRRFWVQTAPRQEYFKKVRQALRIPLDDVLNEAAMAYDEFYASVGRNYEALKAEMNGDAYELGHAVVERLRKEYREKKQEAKQ